MTDNTTPPDPATGLTYTEHTGGPDGPPGSQRQVESDARRAHQRPGGGPDAAA